ncbi:MAG: acetyltransferase family protein [Clostridiales bacterium]|jgi:predicted GNAT family acetyltransferase|nr:acetyltransferase family protein [Clostridiales bacterium]
MRNIIDQDLVFEQLMTEEELIRFSMFYAICIANDSFIVTNDNNVIIGQERPTSPLWIYIKNNLSDDEREEVVKIICERLALNTTLNVDGEEKYLKSILEEVSSVSGVPFKISLPKNSYVCHKPIKPEIICGGLSKARENDLETLSVFSRDNWEDIGFGILTPEQANNFAQRKLTNSDFHVWRNDNERVVAMASVHKYGDVVLTDGVFTDRNERNKGYAKFLMYRITKDLLNEGFMPILYADRRKAAPNHVYKSIGYEYCGEVTEYRFLNCK